MASPTFSKSRLAENENYANGNDLLKTAISKELVDEDIDLLELSKRVGISIASLSRIYRGIVQTPQAKTIEKLNNYFQTNFNTSVNQRRVNLTAAIKALETLPDESPQMLFLLSTIKAYVGISRQLNMEDQGWGFDLRDLANWIDSQCSAVPYVRIMIRRARPSDHNEKTSVASRTTDTQYESYIRGIKGGEDGIMTRVAGGDQLFLEQIMSDPKTATGGVFDYTHEKIIREISAYPETIWSLLAIVHLPGYRSLTVRMQSDRKYTEQDHQYVYSRIVYWLEKQQVIKLHESRL